MIIHYTIINPMSHQTEHNCVEVEDSLSNEDIEREIERVEHTNYFEWWAE